MEHMNGDEQTYMVTGDCDAPTEENHAPLLEKIVGLGADGAYVNTEETGGLIAKLKNDVNSEIVLIKCMAHSLELVFKKAAKDCTLYDKVQTMMSDLFKIYHKSALQKSNLETSYKAANLPFLMPLRVSGTRWVSHYKRALEVLWRGYPAFLLHLKQVIMQF